MSAVDLASFANAWYNPGKPAWVRALWFFVGAPVVSSRLLPLSSVRVWLLRLFGASLGQGLVIKPGVRIKHPWMLTAGDRCWLGEDCWIDNLAPVTLGRNVCISQGAYLCTGNHDWSDPAFGLIVKSIALADGAWAGARSVLCPGARLGEGAIAAAGSVVSGSVPPWEIHAGNPAVFVRRRTLRPETETVVP
jgi:putative colanic acid biosynthesis acetyltransferase WcaF